MYIIIGIICGILYLFTAITNLFADFSRLECFTLGLLEDDESFRDSSAELSMLYLIMAMLLSCLWPIALFGLFMWLLFKLKK